MQTVRKPAVAGLFYPSSAESLKNVIRQCFRDARSTSIQREPRALIVPHAGLRYSGSVAASAYQLLKGKSFSRVLLLGPNHYVPVQGVAAPSVSAFETPLGELALDQEYIQELLRKRLVVVSDLAHEKEHCLEVQLPFIQEIFGESAPKLVPLLVGESSHQQIMAILNDFCKEPEGLVLISSDLSHFETYEDATVHDKRTAQDILTMNWSNIQGEDACGAKPLNGFLNWCGLHRAQIFQIDVRNSGDTAGSRDQVVGYGSFAVNFD